MIPNDATKSDNRLLVSFNLRGNAKHDRKYPKISPNEHVRILMKKDSKTKRYFPKWSEKVYEVKFIRDGSYMISDGKNDAEGAPEETKICLGWRLGTRALLVMIPEHKYVAWTEKIKKLISSKTAGNNELESVLGRLENVAIVIAIFRHFLNNIHSLQIKANKK